MGQIPGKICIMRVFEGPLGKGAIIEGPLVCWIRREGWEARGGADWKIGNQG